MRVTRSMILIPCFVVLAALVAGFFFVFNPLGLGPEPSNVLPSDFFAVPAEDFGELELLVDGEEAFGRILSAIDGATFSVFIQTYIWKDDNIGRKVVASLKAAADRGVEVTIRKDPLGTFFELGDIMKGRPSPVFTRSGLRGYPNIHVDKTVFSDTDHSKYFIIDKGVVVFGGMNIADEYHVEWHDYMALIRSKPWAEAFEKKVLAGSDWLAPSPFVITVNDRNGTEIRTALLEIIGRAEKNVMVEHAYFSDDKVIRAVKEAAARGVSVSIILPKRPDTHLYANRVTINKLLEQTQENVPNIFLYPHMSHAKVVLADGVMAAVGSANLTPRSMLTSREVALFVHSAPDARFIKTLRAQLDADIAQSEQVLEPFPMSLTEKIMALAEKYTW